MSSPAALMILTPEAQAIAAEAETTLGMIQAVQITTPDEAQGAVNQISQIKAMAKRMEEVRMSMTRPLDESKKAIMDFFRAPAETLAKAESVLKQAVLQFQAEQQRIAAAAEVERRRQEEEDRKRQQAEQNAAAKLLDEAEQAVVAGDFEVAEALEQRAAEAQTLAAPILAPVTVAVEKPKGASTRQVWKARVVDPALVPNEYKIINEKALEAYAKTMKQDAKLPGVEFYAEATLAVR